MELIQEKPIVIKAIHFLVRIYENIKIKEFVELASEIGEETITLKKGWNLNMLKPKSNNREFVQEPVKCEEWIKAEITDVKYEEEHEFGGQFAKTGEAVRIVFQLEGYKQPKSSRWLTFSYGEKSNLWLKFLKPLVPGAKPYMDFDVQDLKGIKCKLMFTSSDSDDGKTFYNIEMVRPIKEPDKNNLTMEQLSDISDEQPAF